MILQEFASETLDWTLNFHPSIQWPSCLPVIAVNLEGSLKVIAGFERKALANKVLICDLSENKTLRDLLEEIYPVDHLGFFERIRLEGLLKNPTAEISALLNWPLSIQNFFDGRKLNFKNLKSLIYLTEWQTNICEMFFHLKPSSSECREILDLLWDLKLSEKLNKDFFESYRSMESSSWLKLLKTFRNPQASHQDHQKAVEVSKIPWPRGVFGKWERQGDQTCVNIQSKIKNQHEWTSFKIALSRLEIGETIWTTSI
jgi:hypothetical protein